MNYYDQKLLNMSPLGKLQQVQRYLINCQDEDNKYYSPLLWWTPLAGQNIRYFKTLLSD